MNKKMQDYKKELDKLLEEQSKATDWEAVCGELLVKIGFFQHERFVHLIVTMTVALMLILTFLATVAVPTAPVELLVPAGLLLVLTVPYIIHYYKLENGVQELYEYYDSLKSINKSTDI